MATDRNSAQTQSPEQAARAGADLAHRVYDHQEPADDTLRAAVDNTLKVMSGQSASARDAFWKSFINGSATRQVPELGLSLSMDKDGKMHASHGRKEVYNQAREEHQAIEESTIRPGESAYAPFIRQGYAPKQALEMSLALRDGAGKGPGGFTQGAQYTFDNHFRTILEHSEDRRNKGTSTDTQYDTSGNTKGSTQVTEHHGTKTTAVFDHSGKRIFTTDESSDGTIKQSWNGNTLISRRINLKGQAPVAENYDRDTGLLIDRQTEENGQKVHEWYDGKGDDLKHLSRKVIGEGSGQIVEQYRQGRVYSRTTDLGEGKTTRESYQYGADEKLTKITVELLEHGRVTNKSVVNDRDQRTTTEERTGVNIVTSGFDNRSHNWRSVTKTADDKFKRADIHIGNQTYTIEPSGPFHVLSHNNVQIAWGRYDTTSGRFAMKYGKKVDLKGGEIRFDS